MGSLQTIYILFPAVDPKCGPVAAIKPRLAGKSSHAFSAIQAQIFPAPVRRRSLTSWCDFVASSPQSRGSSRIERSLRHRDAAAASRTASPCPARACLTAGLQGHRGTRWMWIFSAVPKQSARPGTGTSEPPGAPILNLGSTSVNLCQFG